MFSVTIPISPAYKDRSMNISRRSFVAGAAKTFTLYAVPSVIGSVKWLSPEEAKARVISTKTRWAFLVDTHKCVGCGFCVKACKQENGVPIDSPVMRTWVERYVILKDGRVLADTPLGATNGFTDPSVQGIEVKEDQIAKAFFVPKLCNQCENPSCVQVCPVGATYQMPNGIVVVDHSWCIACGYCIQNCPYKARFFHPTLKVADKCTFCVHRLEKDLKPACVLACPFGARQIGNIKDPDDPVTKTITTQRVATLHEEYGNQPQVYYLGLDKHVR